MHTRQILSCYALLVTKAAAPRCIAIQGRLKQCIRIGAATESGDRCSRVHKDDVDFVFTGENVPLKTGNDSPAKLHDGSSVVTAIAAGSAGLLLYLNKLTAKGNGQNSSWIDLREHDMMMKAFTTMSRVTNNNCPRFSHYFNNKFTELAFKMNPDKFYDTLRRIMDKIKVSKLSRASDVMIAGCQLC